jgi:V-type H+-transporting ATPase subunit E
MMEKDVKISGRAKDLSLVQKAAKDAAAEFEKSAGYPVKVEVDGELAAGWYVHIIQSTVPD